MKRRAFSIIELMIAMGTGAVVMSIAIGLVHRSMTVHTAARKQDAAQVAALRLAKSFRHDVHAASDAVCSDDAVRLILSGPADGREVVYTLKPELVTREQTLSDGVVCRESFPLPGCTIIAAQELGDPRRVSLVVRSHGKATSAPPRVVLQIEPTVGTGLPIAVRLEEEQ